VDIQLLVLDLDGTIVGQTNQISEKVKQAIAAAQTKGIQVAIATGRMYVSACQFHSNIASKLPIVAYNGALIQDPLSGDMLYHLPVPSATALDLIQELDQPQWQDKLNLHLYFNDRLYVRQINAETERYAERSDVRAIAVEDFRTILNDDTDPTKILALGKRSKTIDRLMDNLQQRFSAEQLYLTQSSPTFLEATHPLANKGTGVSYLAEQILGLKAEQVMAIGDNFNDVSMLKYAGFSVAMGNAPDAVKETAQWVAPRIDFDGVAVAIEKFLL
jgi:Cof subfamily protein (haloacid dehalogenase superfamily)